jgi:hypothetical protein
MRPKKLPNNKGQFQCSKCKLWKWPDDFYRTPATSVGIMSQCKKCMRAAQTVRNQAKAAALPRYASHDPGTPEHQEAQDEYEKEYHQKDFAPVDQVQTDEYWLKRLREQDQALVEPDETPEQRQERLRPSEVAPDDPLRYLM